MSFKNQGIEMIFLRKVWAFIKSKCPMSKRDWAYTLFGLALATVFAGGLINRMANPGSIALVYILAVFLIARFCAGYFYGLLASVVGVMAVNFLYTYPYYAFNFSLAGYPLTSISMLTISLITSALTSNLKVQARIIAEREKMLMEADKEKMRANLLRAISHDLRTPLTSIIGASSVYLNRNDELSDAEKTDMVKHILEDSNWLLNMVENLLSVTRINNETAKVNKSMEPVEEVMSEAVIRLKKRLPNAKVKVTIPDEFLMIPMDAILIEQVLINLMENAIVHSGSDMPVECFAEADEAWVYFHVKDFGNGVPAEKLDTLFDGSSSTESTSNDGRRGMGIGLSICKTIVLAHGGDIRVRNMFPGAEFVFSLPRE